MFKIKLSDTYFFPVSVEIPIDGGKFQKMTFDAEFKRLPRAEVKEMLARAGTAQPDGTKIDDPLTDDEVLNKVFVGWKGVVDENDAPLPYSETTREAVLSIHGTPSAITNSWLASLAGSKAKN